VTNNTTLETTYELLLDHIIVMTCRKEAENSQSWN